MAWLKALALPSGARAHLTSLIHEHESIAENVKTLDSAVEELSRTERYSRQFKTLTDINGVGILTAMLFLTELGDLDRFPNRGSIKSYVGLAPSSHESGQIKDRKGHITRNGSSRLRAILNQAVWSRLACDATELKWFEGYLAIHSGGKRKAVVVCMARLVQLMWHRALEAQHDYEREVA
jgi:transposase